MFRRSPPTRLSSTSTFAPSAASASTTCDPMNPAPPVTRTRVPLNDWPCNLFQSVRFMLAPARSIILSSPCGIWLRQPVIKLDRSQQLAIECQIVADVPCSGGAHAAQLLWILEHADGGLDECIMIDRDGPSGHISDDRFGRSAGLSSQHRHADAHGFGAR